ncbi:MAG: MotA/TolQ/ExbB proton channel family protein [Planctomycetota bacterium]
MFWDIMHKGGPVMWPLLLCSIIALGIVLERLWFWFNVSRDRDQALINTMLDLAEEGEYDAAAEKARSTRDYVAKILLCGIVHREFSLADALESAAAVAVRMMRRNTAILDTIITLAPLLGILGTVTGIIYAFEFFGSSGIAEPAKVTLGVSQALITTAAGLIIAIGALIPYNYFLHRIDDEESRVVKYCTDLEIVYNRRKQGA